MLRNVATFHSASHMVFCRPRNYSTMPAVRLAREFGPRRGKGRWPLAAVAALRSGRGQPAAAASKTAIALNTSPIGSYRAVR